MRLTRERDSLTEQVTTREDGARIACELLEGFDREVFLVVALSTSARIVGAHIAHVGSLSASIACAREIYRFAILCNARSIIVAHNHPSGNLDVSAEDMAVTRQLREAGDALGIQLLDSLVVGIGGKYTSLAEKGVLQDLNLNLPLAADSGFCWFTHSRCPGESGVNEWLRGTDTA